MMTLQEAIETLSEQGSTSEDILSFIERDGIPLHECKPDVFECPLARWLQRVTGIESVGVSQRAAWDDAHPYDEVILPRILSKTVDSFDDGFLYTAFLYTALSERLYEERTP
jgi:hypothetical protein